MAEQIQVFNVGTNSGNTRSAIASEQTLNELLLAFKTSSLYNEKQAKTLEKLQNSLKSGKNDDDGSANSARKGFRGVGDAARALQDSLKSTPKNFQTFNNLLEHGAQKPVEVLGSGLTKVGNVAEAIAGSKWLKYLGGGILATGIGLVSTSFGVLAGYLQNSLETFQDLSTYGGNFGNSMIDIRRAALDGNLTLTEFSDLVRENSRLFGSMGSSVSNGAAAFSKLSLDVRKFNNYRLREMGFTVKDVNDMLVEYLDVTGRSSNLQDDLNNNQGKVIAGAVKFGTELNELSSITGVNRKELARSVKEQAARGEVTAALMRAQDRGITNVNEKFAAVTTALTPFGPTVMKAAGDLLAFNGAFVTPESQALQRFMPQLAGRIKNLNQSITSNSPGVEVAEAYKGNVKAMLNSRQQLIKMAGMNNEQGRWAQRFLAEQAPLFAKYGNLQGENLEKQLKLDAAEAKRRSDMTAGLSKLEEVFRNIRATIEEKIINSELFEKMSEYLGKFAEYFASPKFENAFNDVIASLEAGLKWIGNIFTESGRSKMWEDITNFWNTGISQLWSSITAFTMPIIKGYWENVKEWSYPLIKSVWQEVLYELKIGIAKMLGAASPFSVAEVEKQRDIARAETALANAQSPEDIKQLNDTIAGLKGIKDAAELKQDRETVSGLGGAAAGATALGLPAAAIGGLVAGPVGAVVAGALGAAMGGIGGYFGLIDYGIKDINKKLEAQEAQNKVQEDMRKAFGQTGLDALLKGGADLESFKTGKTNREIRIIENLSQQFTELQKYLSSLPQREDGGGTGAGGLFRLHGQEYVLSKEDIHSLNTFFADMHKNFNLNDIRNPILSTSDQKLQQTKSENYSEDRIRSLADYSKPEQEQYRAIVESKNILAEMKNKQDEFNEIFLKLYEQSFDLTVQLQKDIEDIAGYYKHNR